MDGGFIKMHGLGNDFVIIDAREAPVDLPAARVRAIADRHRGIGCDQLIRIEPPSADGAAAGAQVAMRIWNADGSAAEACGNASRCVAALIGGAIRVETAGGLIDVRADAAGVAAQLPAPRFEWDAIPIAYPLDTAAIPVGWFEPAAGGQAEDRAESAGDDGAAGGGASRPGSHAGSSSGSRSGSLAGGMAVNVGNPHIIFFVDDAAAVPLATLGPEIEGDALFPDRINVNVAQITGPNRLRLRVWERGAGLTLACGTGACATAVAAIRQRRVTAPVTVDLPGGTLTIDWDAGGPITMTGPATEVFRGHADWATFG